ncbi:unnamed protein product [Prorocentrum cordatum]|uniref:Uncharacterized protein n=1 Tax=Prorocentrum cordatum TaxID=2364126 RepID=A0ABN9T2H9_9DINO|nr:unnamed protein product [Polarella glacialis]
MRQHRRQRRAVDWAGAARTHKRTPSQTIAARRPPLRDWPQGLPQLGEAERPSPPVAGRARGERRAKRAQAPPRRGPELPSPLQQVAPQLISASWSSTEFQGSSAGVSCPDAPS